MLNMKKLVHLFDTSLFVRCLSVALAVLSTIVGYAKTWTGETITANKAYYLYHPTSGGFLHSDGKIHTTPEGVCTWTFSSTTSGTIKSSDGKYVYIKQGNIYEEAGTANINTSSATLDIKNENDKYYSFSLSHTFIFNRSNTYYFAYAGNTIKPIKNSVSEECKWQLISVKQAQNHIEVSSNTIDFGTQSIGSPISQTFTVSGCNPSEIQIVKSGDNDNYFSISPTSVSSPGYNTHTVTVTYKNDTKGLHACTLTVQAAGSPAAYKEPIAVSATTNLLEPTFTWNLPAAINAGQAVENVVSFANGYLSSKGLTLSLEETSSSDLLDISGDAVSGWVVQAKEGVEGETWLTLTANEAGMFAAKTESKKIRVSNKKIQTIVWEQDLTRLVLGGAAVTLNATATSDGTATGKPITYTLSDYSEVTVALSGNVLTIKGEGKLKITATVEEDDVYLGASLTKEIFVRDPNAVCSSETLSIHDDNTRHTEALLSYRGTPLNKSTGALIYDISCANSISITCDKHSYANLNVNVAQLMNGTYTTIGEFSKDGTYTYTVSPNASKIRLSTSSNYSYGIQKVSYTTATPATTPDKEEMVFNTAAGSTTTQSVQIDWVNIVFHPQITGSTSFSAGSGFFGDCMASGKKELVITYTPTAGASTETATLQLLDNANAVVKEIALRGEVSKLPQQITEWGVPSGTFKTTDNINLSTYPITANSGLTAFTYSIVSGAGSIATIDDKGLLSIVRDGTITVRATQPGNEVYNPVSIERTIHIEKVTPTCPTLPKASAILAGAALSTSTLSGGKVQDDKGAAIAGTWAWETPDATPAVSGNYVAVFTPERTGWYNSVRAETAVTVLAVPTFVCSSTALDFGSAVSVIDGATQAVGFSNVDSKGQTLTWHHAFSGTDASCFALDGAITDSGFSVRFNPTGATAHSATLTVWATYTAEGVEVVSAKQQISLSGTGYVPEAGLNFGQNSCDFGQVLGTKKAASSIGLHFVAVSEISTASFSWENGNAAGIFGFTYTAGGTYDGTLSVTAGVSTAVNTETVYEDVLVVKATKTIGGEEITAKLPVRITLLPKAANPLALHIVEDGENGLKAKRNTNGALQYYFIYYDEQDQQWLENADVEGVNPTITFSNGFDTCAVYDKDTKLLSALRKSRRNLTIYIQQKETDEYLAINRYAINVQVVKYTPEISFREGVMEKDTTTTQKRYSAWRNTTYTDFIRTTNHDAPLTVACNTASQENLYFVLQRTGDRNYDLQALNRDGNILLRITQPETDHWEAVNDASWYVYVRKDPRHVDVNPNKQLWENNAVALHGEKFTEQAVNAEWVGDQWVNNAWTGTQWTNGGGGYGSTTAFVLHDGGSVVFHFTGVPIHNYFTCRYPGNKPNGGTYTFEESKDGTVWSNIGSYTAHGGRNVLMSGDSRYLRISYTKGDSEAEWAVLWGGGIYERRVARADKNYVSCVQETAGDEYQPARVTIKTANWGEGGVRIVSNSNPAFSIEMPTLKGNGIDEYREITATIRYNKDLDQAKSAITQIVIKNDTSITKNVKDSVVITVQAISAVVKNIVPGNADKTGLQTGTVAGIPAQYPQNRPYHRGTRNINLTHCFDAAGNALFDRLYIFGMTTATNDSKVTAAYKNADGTTTAVGTPQINHSLTTAIASRNSTNVFNASTTCYVYLRNADGKGYTYSANETFDATQKRFDMGNSMNGKKIYMTGYCPFANTGTSPNHEGWMYFTGGNERVDIYLEDCEIMSKHKTSSGCGTTEDYEYNKVELGIGDNYLTGSGSVFVFHSNGNASGTYTPYIHIIGNNHLKGQYGSLLSEVVGNVLGIEIATGIGNIGQASAPITLLGSKNSGKTNLILDDNWADGSISNGYLKLDATAGTVGSVDLGSASGTATFNGGQYCLRNAAADNSYTCNTVACYRMYEKSAAGQTVRLYGFGTDQPERCTVTINSGTFTMEKNMLYGDAGKDYYRDQVNFSDMRLPGNSIINGGTFNGIDYVLACTDATMQGTRPINSYGEAVCLYKDVPCTGKNTNGSVTFKLPDEFGAEDVYGTTEPSYVVNDNVSNGDVYGGQSVNADGFGFIHLMLPGNVQISGAAWCEELKNEKINNWATSIPSISVGGIGGSVGNVTTGGETEVETGALAGGTTQTTKQLLYTEIDDNILNTSYKEGDMTISFNGKYGVITNMEDYQIDRHLNIMMTVEADRWITFVAPFDISDVSVIEAADEDTLATLSKTDALSVQAEANIDLNYRLSNVIVEDLAGGRTTSTSLQELIPNNIRAMQWARTQAGLNPGNRGYYPLTHYDGTNMRQANWYLYEIDSEDDTFQSDETGANLNIHWKPVSKTAESARADSSVLMHKGKVYAMQFPYCPLCNDVNTRDYYDYWTGKFVVFHGYGPQTVAGTNAHNAIKAISVISGTARMIGNYTFGEMTLSAKSAYIHNTSNDIFELNESATTIKPGQGYMLYAPAGALKVSAISRSGRIVSYTEDENVSTGSHVPTIGDHNSLIVYIIEGGFSVEAIRGQQIRLYDLRGQLLYSGYLAEGTVCPFYEAQGLYLLRGEYETVKIMVK